MRSRKIRRGDREGGMSISKNSMIPLEAPTNGREITYLLDKKQKILTCVMNHAYVQTTDFLRILLIT